MKMWWPAEAPLGNPSPTHCGGQRHTSRAPSLILGSLGCAVVPHLSKCVTSHSGMLQLAARIEMKRSDSSHCMPNRETMPCEVFYSDSRMHPIGFCRRKQRLSSVCHH